MTDFKLEPLGTYLANVTALKEYLAAARSEDEWATKVDTIKQLYNGYPPFWYQEIVLSGFLAKVANSFGHSGEIEVVIIQADTDETE